jgi:hypothetical protein
MSILRRTSQSLLSLRHHLCAFSDAVAVEPAPSDPPSPFFDPLAPLDYLPDFPRPDPKYNEKILSIHQTSSGKNISGKLREVTNGLYLLRGSRFASWWITWEDLSFSLGFLNWRFGWSLVGLVI